MYRIDLLVLGKVSEQIFSEDKEKIIKYILTFRQADHFAFKLYINDEYIPDKQINKRLEITNKMILNSILPKNLKR